MKHIALVTYSGYPELTPDDRMLVSALESRSAKAVPVLWDSTTAWGQFDRIIIRSCWDYHLRHSEFIRWIDSLERFRAPLHNSATLVRWNADKSYLREMERAGVRIPATVWVKDGEEQHVHAILTSHEWESAVVKPTISASAHNLKRVFVGEPEQYVRGPAIVQQFLPEVAVSGEWSIMFFRGEYSHSVVKTPKPGDFRVQSEYGGRAQRASPSSEILRTARAIVNALPELPLYARIDGVVDTEGFVLMEVELIEPVMYLQLGGAADRFAEAIMNSSHD